MPRRPPRRGDVHVLLSLGRLTITPGRPIGAENNLEAAVVALTDVRHDVFELGAELLDDMARAELSIRSELTHVDILIAAAAVAGIKEKGAEPSLNERWTALRSVEIGAVRRAIEHDGRAPSSCRALSGQVYVPASAGGGVSSVIESIGNEEK